MQFASEGKEIVTANGRLIPHPCRFTYEVSDKTVFSPLLISSHFYLWLQNRLFPRRPPVNILDAFLLRASLVEEECAVMNRI
jgi:hypothetical protein